jgi:hypothetical protein
MRAGSSLRFYASTNDPQSKDPTLAHSVIIIDLDVIALGFQDNSEKALCDGLTLWRRQLSSLSNRYNAESNPLIRDNIQQQYDAAKKGLDDSIARFVSVGSFDHFSGVVSGMNMQHYNSGPGVTLGIDLPCNAAASFQFLDITNPGWGGLDPKIQTPLGPWRAVLQRLSIHTAVTFSGHFFLRNGPSQINIIDPKQPVLLEGTITGLSS